MALKLYRAQMEFWHETNSLGVFWPVVGDQLDPDLVRFEKLISALAKDQGTSNGFLKKIQIYQKQEELVGKNIICARYGPYALPNEIRRAGARMDSRYPHCAFAVYDFEDEGDHTNTLLQRRFLLPGDDMYLGYHSDTYIRQVKSDDIHGSRDHSRGLG